HQNTDHQRESQQGHQVQGIAKHLNPNKGSDQGGRNSDHDDQSVSQTVQEKQHDHRHQQNRQEKVKDYGIGRFEGINRAVIGDLQLQSFFGIILIELGNEFLYSFTHFHRVGIGLFQDLQDECAFAIHSGQLIDI